MSPLVRVEAAPAAGAAARRQARKGSDRSAAAGAGQQGAARAKPGRKRTPGAGKIVRTLLPGFSRQLSAMLSAGMPIIAALEAQEEQIDNPNFRPVISSVKASIQNGADLSDALAQFPAIFDTLYVNMVRGGESGGQLAETIGRIAGFLEANGKLRRKVKSATMYPVIVLCLALGIATGMIVFVVPVFGGMFEGLGGKLPGPTQFLLDLSHLIRDNGLIVIIVVTIIVVAFRKWKGSPTGAYQFDKFMLALPVFGELTKKVASARFARTFGQLIRSGVPILQALEIVAGATGNKVTGVIIMDARVTVENGEPLSSALVRQKVFPLMLVRMLQAGEKTGKVDEMMDSIAEFYEDEVETMLNGLTSLLEPLLMIVLGVLIGGIVISMFLPIFKIGEIVQGG